MPDHWKVGTMVWHCAGLSLSLSLSLCVYVSSIDIMSIQIIQRDIGMTSDVNDENFFYKFFKFTILKILSFQIKRIKYILRYFLRYDNFSWISMKFLKFTVQKLAKNDCKDFEMKRIY